MRAFRRTGEGLQARFEPAEVEVLAGLAAELVGVLDAGEELDRDDPAVARLFPDAHRDDAAAAVEFRDMVHGDLREAKVAGARALASGVRAALKDRGRVLLDDETAEQWLTAINDLRLVLGTRLGVTEEMDEVGRDDPRYDAFGVYRWLSYLQETLVEALDSC